MIGLAGKVLAAAPRVRIDRPARNRREAPRLCLAHWRQLRDLVFDPKRPAADDRRLMLAAQDALVGNAAFLAGDRAAELADDGCPVCFLNAEHAARCTASPRCVSTYDVLIDLAASHVLGGVS